MDVNLGSMLQERTHLPTLNYATIPSIPLAVGQ